MCLTGFVLPAANGIRAEPVGAEQRSEGFGRKADEAVHLHMPPSARKNLWGAAAQQNSGTAKQQHSSTAKYSSIASYGD
jgi:hypothetical protein